MNDNNPFDFDNNIFFDTFIREQDMREWVLGYKVPNVPDVVLDYISSENIFEMTFGDYQKPFERATFVHEPYSSNVEFFTQAHEQEEYAKKYSSLVNPGPLTSILQDVVQQYQKKDEDIPHMTTFSFSFENIYTAFIDMIKQHSIYKKFLE